MTKLGLELDVFEVAEAYYGLPASTRDFKELAKSLFPDWQKPGFDMKFWQNRLSRMVRELERKGLIHHAVLRKDAEFLPRKPDLEDRLRRRFGLRQAVVVDIASLAYPARTPATHPEQWNRYDDEIHKRLGAWCGRLLASCLRPGDKIATGGGRGPHYTVDRCRVGVANRYWGNIVPLTGRISTRGWDEKGDTSYLDADNVATTLHGKLGTQGKVESPNCSITKKCVLPSTDEVAVAVIGVGALGGGHRLKDFEGLEDVKTVLPTLRETNKMAEAIEQSYVSKAPPFYHPVGDVCNWYFVVDPAGDEGKGKERQSLEKAVKELNGKFMNATPKSLSRIAARGMVVAVAGGPHKAAAIRHVLRRRQEGPWITHLVTDHIAAGWILAGEKQPGVHELT
jgi:DNA-binding transcriptional regulator LsrR (DeoR family)